MTESKPESNPAPESDSSPNPQNPQASSPDDKKSARGKTPASRERSVVERRTELGRREPRADTTAALERRRGPGRRRSDFTRAAEEGELTTEQFLFLMAIEEFKTANSVCYPAWTDVLEVIRLLGYRKTQSSAFKLRNAEDWRESPSAAANVRPDRWAERFDDDELRELGEHAA